MTSTTPRRSGTESTGASTGRSGRQGPRSLLLLTDFYPYEVGEEFLEQEIEMLCAAYDEVVVVPVRLSEGARQTRALPANAPRRSCGAGSGWWRHRRGRVSGASGWMCVSRRSP